MPIQSVNPATGQKLREFRPLASNEIDEKITRAHQAFQSYRRIPIAERVPWMLRAADILEKERARWGRIMTEEMGKPIRAAREEAAKCATACRYYAENAPKFLMDRIVSTNADRSYVHFQPMGVVLAIMPWNFPFWQVFRFAAPALMAGNVAILKHASNVPQCALAIEEIFYRAGFPRDVFQTLLVSSDQVSDILRDPRVVAATLTGSDQAGIQVARVAGEELKKTVLELGGSDPFIVMPSANLDEAVQTAVNARIINNGESCIAAKRFIVAEEIAPEFERRFVEAMRALKLGDPTDEEVGVGPLATPQILEGLAKQVDDSVRAGARLLLGGHRLDRPGNFYAPTVLTDIPKDAPAYSQELFGPVAMLFRVRGLDEAIALANESRYGLGSSFWSSDPQEQSRFVEEVEAGLCFVNGMVASDPRLPFGGVKHSGYGRELSEYGIHEFVNIKTVWIKQSGRGGGGGGPRTGTE